MTTRVNKLDFDQYGGTPTFSLSFDGGVCDCAIVKIERPNHVGAHSVTYGGISMVNLGSLSAGGNYGMDIFGLQDAPQGSVTIVVTTDNDGGLSHLSVESYIGVSKTATFPNASNTGEHHTGSGSSLSLQVDVTTTVDDCILVGLGFYVDNSGITYMSAGAGTTNISHYPPTGGQDVSFESNPLVVGAAGTHSLIGTTGGGDPNFIMALIVVALVGESSTTTPKGNMFLLF